MNDYITDSDCDCTDDKYDALRIIDNYITYLNTYKLTPKEKNINKSINTLIDDIRDYVIFCKNMVKYNDKFLIKCIIIKINDTINIVNNILNDDDTKIKRFYFCTNFLEIKKKYDNENINEKSII